MEGVLLDQEHRELLLRIELRDGAEYLPGDERSKPKGGLVEEKQAGASHQCAADCEHLLLAPGKCASALLHALLEQGKQREYPFQISVEMRGGCKRGADLQVLHHGHAQEDAAAFRRLRDLEGGNLVRGQARDVTAGKNDAAFARART